MQKRAQYRSSMNGSPTNTNTANCKWYNNLNIVSKTPDGSSMTLLNDTQFTIKYNKGHSVHEDNTDADTDTVITLLRGTEWWAPSLGGNRHAHLPSISSASRTNPPFTPSRFEGYNY
nr:uncharacterized protein I203_06518 [Kwoniella mangroviensis CBS 8507]OCF64337.1 hypothetical protein I203_06518 [Kwoniella mangroviensis CBS 8507]